MKNLNVKYWKLYRMGKNGMKNGMKRKGENIGKSRVFWQTFQTFRKFQKKYIPPETFLALPFLQKYFAVVYVFLSGMRNFGMQRAENLMA